MDNSLVKRQDAIDALSHMCSEDENGITVSRANVNSMLRALPSAQPEPKTGEWNFIGDQMFECTNCGVAYTEYQFEKMRVRYNDPKFPRFCPNCGADMRGEKQ